MIAQSSHVWPCLTFLNSLKRSLGLVHHIDNRDEFCTLMQFFSSSMHQCQLKEAKSFAPRGDGVGHVSSFNTYIRRCKQPVPEFQSLAHNKFQTIYEKLASLSTELIQIQFCYFLRVLKVICLAKMSLMKK